MNVSTQCSCGLVTVANVLSIHDHRDMNEAGYYAIVRWQVEDIHNIRKEMGLSKWEDHEAEAFLEVHDSSISDMMSSTGWEWIRDLLGDS
tara:strand:- start:3737 stop:4006 length:270 start_codon:yes stop_codon:yes gene_type:complete